MRSAVPRAMAAVAGVALALAIPASAQRVDARDSDELLLRNGQWTWIEDAALQPIGGASGVTILVSLPAQLAFVYRDGVLIAASTISTGKPGKTTPAGDYTILQKRVHHRSNLYSNAPMPFMQRLTWDGIALHAGHLPGYPASHGCIRFPRGFAERLYAITELGTAVSVVNYEVVDPRVRRGAPRLRPEQVAARQPQPRAPASAPFLRAEVKALYGAEYDDVTFSHDVLIPALIGGPIPPDDRVTAPGATTGSRTHLRAPRHGG